MMNGVEFITATDGKQFYMDSFLKCIVYAYHELIDSKNTYSRKDIHHKIKTIHNSDKAHNEIEDYLCTDLVLKYIKPNLSLFGLENLVVDVGVREVKENVTVGHLDIKFQVPSLSDNFYYAVEAKRIDKNTTKQKYYISGGIERFTNRVYYPETSTIVAGMIGFIEIDLSKSKKGRVAIDVIKDSLNSLIEVSTIDTSQILTNYKVFDNDYMVVDSFEYVYLSKHIRVDDKQELKIYHVFLDYYDILLN